MISSRGKGKEKLDESSIRSGYKTWYNVGGNVARVGMSLILRRRGISRFTRGGGNYGVAATSQVTQYFRGGEKKARAAGWNG